MNTDREAQTRDRFLYYYKQLKNKQCNMDFQQSWEIFSEKEAELDKNTARLLPDFLSKVDDTFFVIECRGLISDLPVEEKEEESVLLETWNRVVLIIKKESEWEQKCYQLLKEIADAHPITAWIIATVLCSVLLGLLTNCIYDGIVGR